uniref:SWIM-type domain-containing protein n=1 Tax=Amphimedon queenslandica TaxID=400682 RepID=A0A1X7UQ97_AMPQE
MGNWKLKDEYHFMARDSTLMPQLPKVVDPKEIVETVKNGSLSISALQENNDVHVKRLEIPPLNTTNAQLSLAQDIVDWKFVTLADGGCWLVKSVNEETPQAARLHLKEACTCSQAKGCYHILACKIMSGQVAKDFTYTKLNMSTLQQRIRKKNKEKPSGRKQPRKNDFFVRRNGDSDDEGATMDNNAKQQS